MYLLQQFLDYLSNQTPPASSATIKNYKADIKKFVTWYQQEFQKEFSPSLITIQIIDFYKKEVSLSPRTIDRHLSSLRKFFSFLERIRAIQISPFTLLDSQKTEVTDPWKIKEFKDYLYNNNVSPLTIKNYVIDILQFSRFVSEVTKPKEEWDLSQKPVFECITEKLIEEYKRKLLKEVSPSSVNRKLSSLRKFTSWIEKEVKVPPNLTVNEVVSENVITYSTFPPLRFSQKIKTGVDFAFDSLITIPLSKIIKSFSYMFWKLQGSPVFVEKAYKPLHSRSLLQKVILKYYFHFSILVICIGLVGYGFYSDFLTFPQKNSRLLALSSTPPRILSFQGRLTNTANTPITSSILVKFSLYNDPTSSESALLWEEAQDITPNNDGVFSVVLGKQKTIPQSVFAQNSNVYIGVTVGKDPELLPRQQIATVGYAQNAEVLQGMPAITQAGSGEKNVILALDSSGNLTIGGIASPVFQATGGTLKLSGQQLLLTSNTGSNGNVQIIPDGNGKIDIQKPIINSSNNGSQAPGAVEVMDSFSVLATESARAAFSLNNNSTGGNIMTASSSGITRFVIDNGGNVGIGGVSNPGSALQVAGSITPKSNNDSNLGSTSLYWKTLYANNISLPTTGGTGGYLQLSSGVLSPTNITNDFAIGGISTSAAKFNITSTNGNFASAGTLTLSALTAGVLQTNSSGVVSSNLGTANYIPKWSSTGLSTTSNIFDNGTNVGIGDITPTEAKLVVGDAGAGDIFAAYATSSNTERLCWDGSGASLITDCSGTPGDYAEEYGTYDTSIQAADVVAIDGDRSAIPFEKGGEKSSKAWIIKSNRKYQASVIGIVSTNPAEVIGKVYDKSENARPVALNGKVSVKVVTENGPIRRGDFLTSSSTPGVAMKATQAGIVIGKALSDFKSDGIGMVTVFVNNSWYDPTAYITDSGDLSIIPSSPNNPNKNFAVVIASTFDTLSVNSAKQSIMGIAAVAESGLAMTKRVGVYSELIAANIRTGFIQAQEISSQALVATTARLDQITSNEIISPIIEANQLKTNYITPLSSDTIVLNGKIVIAASSPSLRGGRADEAISAGSLNPRDDVVLEVQGSASISGNLTAQNAQFNNLTIQQFNNNGDATISGTLRADHIIANSIDGLDANIATIAAKQFSNYESGIRNQESGKEKNHDSLFIIHDSTGSAQFNNVNANFGRFNLGLVTLGGASFADASVSNQLSINTSLKLADNSINVLGADLELQPFRQGGISMLSGLIQIDMDGNLKAQGADFAKNVNVMGNFAANIISPLPNSDIIFRLGNVILTSPDSIASLQNDGGDKIQNDSKFVIQNANSSPVFEIDSSGSLIASGAGIFKDLIGKGLSIVREAQADTSLTETIASGSAGFATIIQGETERTIINPYVKYTSLIYITPTSDTQGAAPYIARQIAEDPKTKTKGLFVIQIPQAVYKDIKVNWWIVN